MYLFYLPLVLAELRLSRHLCPSLLLEALELSTTHCISSNLEITAAFFMSGGICFRITEILENHCCYVSEQAQQLG